MRLLLVRHGQSLGNVEHRIQDGTDPLTEIGRKQARALAALLAQRGDITHLYTSPLDRARETAAIVGTTIDLEPTLVPGLAEIHTGDAAGLLWVEWRERYPDLAVPMASEDRNMESWPGGEHGRDFAQRVLAAYDEIVTRHTGTDDVVTMVSHGGSLSWIAALVHGDSLDRWPTRRSDFANCSVSEITIASNGCATIGPWNQHAHIDALNGRRLKQLHEKS